MDTNMQIAAIAVDLKRIANAYHANSISTGERFVREVIESKRNINVENIEEYMKKTLKKLDSVLSNSNHIELAEDALMYSSILQNYYIFQTRQ